MWMVGNLDLMPERRFGVPVEREGGVHAALHEICVPPIAWSAAILSWICAGSRV